MTATSRVMLPSGGRRTPRSRGCARAGADSPGLALAPTCISAFVPCLPTHTWDLRGEGLWGDSGAPGPSGPRQDFCPQLYFPPHGGRGSWPPVSLPWSRLSQLRALPLAGLRPRPSCVLFIALLRKMAWRESTRSWTLARAEARAGTLQPRPAAHLTCRSPG